MSLPLTGAGPSGAGIVLLNWSTFTDNDDTSLDAITPEIGGAWTEQNRNWDIQSNKASALANGAGLWVATVESNQSDIRCPTIISIGGGHVCGAFVRYSNGPDGWYIAYNTYANEFLIYEVNDSTTTERASTAYVGGAGDYTIEVTTSAATITATIEGGNEIGYASATRNQTATLHGICTGVAGASNRFNDFKVYG